MKSLPSFFKEHTEKNFLLTYLELKDWYDLLEGQLVTIVAKDNVQTASKDLLCIKSSHLGNTIRFRSVTGLFELSLPLHCSQII